MPIDMDVGGGLWRATTYFAADNHNTRPDTKDGKRSHPLSFPRVRMRLEYFIRHCLKPDVNPKRRGARWGRGGSVEFQEDAGHHPASVPLPLRVRYRALVGWLFCFASSNCVGAVLESPLRSLPSETCRESTEEHQQPAACLGIRTKCAPFAWRRWQPLCRPTVATGIARSE